MADDKKPIRWEVSEKTGNKRPVYLDDQGKEYYGDVIKASYDPYGGLTEDELSNLLSEDTPLRKTKVSGSQGPGEKGTFGKDVTVEDWIKRNPEYAKSFEEKYGRKFNPKTDAKTFQKEYNQHVENITFKRAKEAGYSDDEAKSLAKKFKETQGFKSGTKIKGDPRYMDTQFGEYTSSRFEPIFKPKNKEPEKEPEKEEEDQDVTLPPEKEGTKAGPIAENPIIPQLRGREKAPWWLQDIIQTAGAAGDLARIKRYPPWQATPQVRLPDATFYDPTRELAANAEQANMAYQAQTAFTNPQQLAAASAVTQGQAAKNAADVMGRYNNLNVGLANQLSKERTDIMNAASQNKANLDTQLWDKYTIMNQQFDNSKAQARQNLRNSYISAITNRANTANMNSLYPQYAVDPSTGGFSYFKGNNSKLPATTKYDYMDSLWEKAKQYSPNDPETMMQRLLQGTKGTASETEDDGTTNPYQQYS